jgi:hypothetical protein
MIGTIDEAKKKLPPDKQATRAGPEEIPAAKVSQEPNAASMSKSETRLKPEPKLEPEGEHAVDTHKS